MITITPDKILFDGFEYQDIKREISPNDLIKYLAEDVELEDGVTFGRIFDLILLHKNTFNIIFYAKLYGYDIGSFEKQFKLEDNREDKNIDYLYVSRGFEHMLIGGEDTWNYWYNFNGYGSWNQKDDEGNETYGGISISLTPLNELKNIPIKIIDELDVVVDNGKKYEEIKTIKEKFKSLHVAHYPISLFNFIGAILYEITYHGEPESKDEIKNELDNTIKRIKNGDEKLYELKKDENDRFFFEDSDGNIDYLTD